MNWPPASTASSHGVQIAAGNIVGNGVANMDGTFTYTHVLPASLFTPETMRECLWTNYGQICRTGNTQLLLDSMKCFGQNPHCWTFSDPNDAASCLSHAHAAGVSASASSFLQQICMACGGAGNCASAPTSGTAELIPYVSDQEVAAISACRGTACTSAAVAANCNAVPDVMGIFGCK